MPEQSDVMLSKTDEFERIRLNLTRNLAPNHAEGVFLVREHEALREAAQAVVDAWKQGDPEAPESVRMRALAAALNRDGSLQVRCRAAAKRSLSISLAYDPKSKGDPDSPFRGPSYWYCSAILLGEAIPAGQPGAVEHTDRLAFAFYDIKSEDQPSARGATTRPKR